ncbi:N-acetyltransferase esco2 [Mortierella alpina]|uniref:N-acetyltransferase esco2 n=1 Tax=Mortierella alpina TaxID=64518 RepID=A0A9P6M6I9_MORAP|nr:N-acetyltransferase esco2 [Mortierella alpina]
MNSPATSRSNSSSDVSSTSGPETPQREYKFHKAVRNTYGRAVRSALESPSSPEVWTSPPKTTPSASSSPLERGRFRPSGSFSSGFATSDPWDTPTRGTRTLTEKLERAKLEFDSDDDELFNKNPLEQPDRDDELHNVFMVKDIKKDADRGGSVAEDEALRSPRTPVKRKQQFIEVEIPIRSSPRRRKILVQDKEQDRDGTELQSKGGWVSPRLSPSPPSSPSQRSRRVALQIPTPASSATSTDSNRLKSADARRIGSSKQPTLQASISSFFTPKAGNGTGILKTRGSHNSDQSTETEAISPSNRRQSGKSSSTSAVESAVKLEQLFLSFSKDRTKALSSPSKASPTSTRTPKLSLQREDEKSKRYHCPQCRMPFVRGQQEDEQIHDRYHRAVLGGIDYPGYKNEVVVAQFSDPDFGYGSRRNSSSINSNGKGNNSSNGDSSLDDVLSGSRIVMVTMSDSGRSNSAGSGGSSAEKKKVKEVLQMMNKELGSVDFDPEQLEACKVFLYISGKKKVVGCVIAERIRQGYEILSLSDAQRSIPGCDPTSTDATSAEAKTAISALATSAPSALSKTGTTDSTVASQGHEEKGEAEEDESSAIFCSTVPQPAICGINRIWVSRHYRRQRIASRMLDAVRNRFNYACKLDKKDLAFSQPTGDGKALAKQYLGTERFLVYVE